jgi:hypothetical protein
MSAKHDPCGEAAPARTASPKKSDHLQAVPLGPRVSGDPEVVETRKESVGECEMPPAISPTESTLGRFETRVVRQLSERCHFAELS